MRQKKQAVAKNKVSSITKASKPPLRALAVCAHPDDVEIYCLGLLLQLQILGWEIGWVIATDGQAGLADANADDQRRKEATQAGAIVGVKPMLLGLEDGQLSGDECEQTLLRQAVHGFAPNLLISHAPNDYHPDHRTLSKMVTQICPVQCALIYADTMCGIDFLPEFSVDISAVFDQKIAAFKEHQSQSPTSFIDKIALWNQFRALQTAKRGLQYAESYCIVRAVGRPSVFQLLGNLVI